MNVLYCISHGFAARMIVQTGLIEKFLEKNLSVGIISSDPNDSNFVTLKKKYERLELISYPKRRSRAWLTEYIILRMYLFEDISQNAALWEKHLFLKRKKGKNPYNHIRPHLYYFLHLIVYKLKLLHKLVLFFERIHLRSHKVKDLLLHINPQIVVSTYPVAFDEAVIIQNARMLGLKTIIHLLSWDNITCKGRFPALAEKYFVWGEIMKAELIKYYGVNEENIYPCGVAHFDIHSKNANELSSSLNKRIELEQNSHYMMFAMSSPYFAPNEIGIVEELAKQVENNRFGKDTNLVVRPHPQNVIGNMSDQSWLPRLKKINSERVVVDFPQLIESDLPWSMQFDDMIRLSMLLRNAFVCINSGSTMSIDSLMTETPVIITSFDGNEKIPYWQSATRLIEFPHLKKFISFGGVPITKSFEELFKVIDHFRQDGSWLKEEREITRYQECGINDGLATNRITNEIIFQLSEN